MNNGKYWSSEEQKLLLHEFTTEAKIEEIAVSHGRTNGAITSRARHIAAGFYRDGMSMDEIMKQCRLTRQSLILTLRNRGLIDGMKVLKIKNACIRNKMAAIQIAQALWFPYTDFNICLCQLFSNQSQNVINEGLMIAAEWRDLPAMEKFCGMGANLHYVNAGGFSVLETVLQGHDGSWRENVESAKMALLFLNLHGVTRKDITHDWIIEQDCDVFIAKDKWIKDFLCPPTFEAWWHKPGDSELNSLGEYSFDPRDADEWKKIPAEQFIYVVKSSNYVNRYIVTKGLGYAEIFPLNNPVPSVDSKLMRLASVLKGELKMPVVPGETE